MIRPCPACGARNRVPAQHLAHEGKCGSCQAALPPVAEPIDADPATFEEIAREAKVPVLVDFWAAWCGPCKMAAPEVAQAARNLAGRAVVVKVDTDAHGELAQRYGVTGIPNFVVLKEGCVVKQQPGYVRHTQLEDWLKQAGA